MCRQILTVPGWQQNNSLFAQLVVSKLIYHNLIKLFLYALLELVCPGKKGIILSAFAELSFLDFKYWIIRHYNKIQLQYNTRNDNQIINVLSRDALSMISIDSRINSTAQKSIYQIRQVKEIYCCNLRRFVNQFEHIDNFIVLTNVVFQGWWGGGKVRCLGFIKKK